MPVKECREYRSFALMTPADEQDNSSGYVVEGYATTFDESYDLGFGGMREMVRSTALIGADMSDVIFQLNHEGAPHARTRNGTLSITFDDHGMKVRADLCGSHAARDLHEAIRNGLIDRMSWGFIVAEDGWEYDEENRIAIITKVEKVFDVSAVSIPANEGTEIHARSYIDGVIEFEGRESAQRKASEKQKRARLAVFLETV